MSMTLLRGGPAATALRGVLAQPDHRFVCVDIDPDARRGRAPQLLTICGVGDGSPGSSSFQVDLGGAADKGLFLAVLATAPLVGAESAKLVLRLLLDHLDYRPRVDQRWACPLISERLIAGGRDQDCTLAGIAERLNVPPPADADSGLTALAQRGRAVGEILEAQIPDLHADQLGAVSKLESAVALPLAAMENRGLAVDSRAWRAHLSVLVGERDRLLSWLNEALQLPSPKHSDLFAASREAAPTDAVLRTALGRRGMHLPNMRRRSVASLPPPYAERLRRLRELQKILTAYGERFLEHVRSDGRVHPTFSQIGASSGRMACHEPNLQAMVKDQTLRGCLRAGPGHTLIIADYATCELRILAEMSGDPKFTAAFLNNEDLHASVASQMFGKTVSKTDNPHLRDRAKAINFGLVYGMGHRGLARQLGIEPARAQELMQDYFRRFPRIGGFLQDTAQRALKERGYAATISGRRLYFSESDVRDDYAQCERIAKNMPIQGTSADITKIALAEIHRALGRAGSTSQAAGWLVNVVHDEVVVECPVARAEEIEGLVRAAMENAAAQVLRRIPMAVDTRINNAWIK